jgi:hypothetical protein
VYPATTDREPWVKIVQQTIGRASPPAASARRAADAVAEVAKAWHTAAYGKYFETKAQLGEKSAAAVQKRSSPRRPKSWGSSGPISQMLTEQRTARSDTGGTTAA